MSKSTLPEHTVSQKVRLLAAGAIGLRGHWANSSEITNSSSTQYQAYPPQSFFGTPLLGDIQAMALVMSRCAAVVVFMATRVVIPPDGATSIAKVLHLMVLDKDPGKTEWIYRSRKVSETRVYDLHIDGRLRVSEE
ncbi:unnamed protein product [Clonostachys chloroleuca]|uniref:Uncharacterized protein n=1 Tax=Clonostachys chloroleuca TaxID=1926264 RepID=A0AA35LPS9_9HYPO|nr:unnamed protein product [Clonostachys chloroleuca]